MVILGYSLHMVSKRVRSISAKYRYQSFGSMTIKVLLEGLYAVPEILGPIRFFFIYIMICFAFRDARSPHRAL
jgi:hypothetical protein